MFWTASLLLRLTYLLLPAVSAAVAVRARPRWRRFIVNGWISGLGIATVVLAAYAVGIGGHLSIVQAAVTLYLGVGLMLFLKIVDALLTNGLRRVLLRRRVTNGKLALVTLLRLTLFGAVALPWVMAAAMVYRPKVIVWEPPAGDLVESQRVFFKAADGQTVAGWFMPAANASQTTALLCHGLGGGAAGFTRLINDLHDADVNVLAIELRAHGQSAGQLCSFGRYEQNDVLGAIQWLKAERANEADRIVGVGASLGAAALLAAAGDDPRIDGVAVLSTYATLPDEVLDVSRRNFVWPVGWLVRTFGLPIASLHVGVDLRTVRPVDDVARLWPRPVFVVHGTDDEIIPYEHGRRIYDAAPIGRSSLWVSHGTHNGILDDRDVIGRVIEFIRSVRPTLLV